MAQLKRRGHNLDELTTDSPNEPPLERSWRLRCDASDSSHLGHSLPSRVRSWTRSILVRPLRSPIPSAVALRSSLRYPCLPLPPVVCSALVFYLYRSWREPRRARRGRAKRRQQRQCWWRRGRFCKGSRRELPKQAPSSRRQKERILKAGRSLWS